MAKRKATERGRPQRVNTDAQEIAVVRTVMVDSLETIKFTKAGPVLPHRGDLPLIQLIAQAEDTVNLVSMEVHIGDRSLVGIRSLTKAMALRVIGLVRGSGKPMSLGTIVQRRVRVVVIVG